MLACFGPKGGSDDKQHHAAHGESAGGNLPARGGSEMRSSNLMILARYSGPRSGGGSSKNQPARVFGVNSIRRLVMRMRFFIVGVGMGRRPALVVSADLQQGVNASGGIH